MPLALATQQVEWLSAFPKLPTKVSRKSAEFAANSKSWDEVLGQFQAALKKSGSQGSVHSLDRHVGRGQLLGTSFIAPALSAVH
jgi:hypothetical protein